MSISQEVKSFRRERLAQYLYRGRVAGRSMLPIVLTIVYLVAPAAPGRSAAEYLIQRDNADEEGNWRTLG